MEEEQSTEPKPKALVRPPILDLPSANSMALIQQPIQEFSLDSSAASLPSNIGPMDMFTGRLPDGSPFTEHPFPGLALNHQLTELPDNPASSRQQFPWSALNLSMATRQPFPGSTMNHSVAGLHSSIATSTHNTLPISGMEHSGDESSEGDRTQLSCLFQNCPRIGNQR